MFRNPRQSRSRGAVAIETVLVVPLLLLLAFGSIELGNAWKRSREVNNATRSAARVASNLGDIRQADWQALLTLRAGINDLDTVEGVAIYKSTTVDGAVPDACRTASVANVCNHYSRDDLKTLADADFANDLSCAGAPDAAWCPLDRNTNPAGNPDYIGVWVHITQDPITDVFPGKDKVLDIEDTTVMRAEPAIVG